ncbi:BMP family ABC transporter substrate-binding protein [Aggregicoccus sp. 17bor-14]|uniref:BMP family lipoprotein n=1 Tax=Myxococcaceae TaxID=31 RepID=UPI00129CEF1C|nr:MULTISPECIES: BMP family ABC transporter substrate-binding protein [Myxococcaceae]MBF5044310.1 BMP family ABC transporter substrate-binding protein [Simulacricoccus sp. 17bor-14]MRI90059.1 BMP family ABC transporter substrate-binding protein [Aggregicoccus sp. 17bor-14]
MIRTLLPALTLAALLCACAKKKDDSSPAAPPSAPSAEAQAAKAGATQKVGLVTDIAGRGDQSFNDSALRGLELWAAGKRYVGGRYLDATPETRAASLSPGLPEVKLLPVTPLVLQSKAPEDYEPNLQLLVDQGAALTIGVGYLLEPAMEAVARRNPDARFVLIDSPLLDARGKPFTLPNVHTVVFREEEGSFLVGALAGLATRTGTVGFVGGMQVPLIRKFEAGFRAGVMTTNPKAAERLLVSYTGSFDNVSAGKQVGQDLLAKGADVVFHAAGGDGLGVIQAVKEARAAGKSVFVIGVDSDQSHVAPDAVLTSMVKRVDLAVYSATKELTEGRFQAGDQVMGLKEGGVGYVPVTLDFPGKAEALARVEALAKKIAAGEIQVPANLQTLAAFKAQP